MSGFDFSATARCNVCGNYLDDSTEDCDHDGEKVYQFLFRHIHPESADEHQVMIRATASWKWCALAETVGDEWSYYRMLGSRSHVSSLLRSPLWESVEELPYQQMFTEAECDPEDVL